MAETATQFSGQLQNVSVVYNIYRIVLPLVLLITYITNPEAAQLGSLDDTLFVQVCTAYAIFGVVMTFIAPSGGSLLSNQNIITGILIIDILAITLLVYTCGGVGSGLGLLLLVTIASGSILIRGTVSTNENPFVAVNCGAIPEKLMESELFGHLKGSFTGADQDKQGLFQAADGGTLFLDEVVDLPLHTQVKLLRVIQEKAVRPVGSQQEQSVDVRLLSATHKNLAQEVESGHLRQDLYFRINVIELAVPSLRERKEDIPELAENILRRIAQENGVEVCQLSIEAMGALQKYNFPGNVRELENILQRAATLCENNIIQESNLEFINTPTTEIPAHSIGDTNLEASDSSKRGASDTSIELDEDFSLEKHLEAIEIEAIERALEETRWNKTAAAKKLGMSFRSLRYRLKKLGLD